MCRINYKTPFPFEFHLHVEADRDGQLFYWHLYSLPSASSNLNSKTNYSFKAHLNL